MKNSGELPYHDVTYLPCPECHELMYRRNFASNSNIIVDECNGHGVWFDHKELAAAIEHLHSKFTVNPKQTEIKTDKTSKAESSARQIFSISEEDLKLLLKEYPEYFNKPPGE